MIKNLYFILILLVFTACLDEPDCVQEASNEIKFLFLNAEDSTARGVEFNKITLIGTDTLFSEASTASTVIIPVNPFDTQATIIFDSNDAVDTITFRYDHFTRLISPDCGTETFIQNVNIIANTFDLFRIVEPTLAPGVTVNYEIFY